MTDTHDAIDQHRQFIAILCDVMRLAAQSGEWETHIKYKSMRCELTGALHGTVDAILGDGTLSNEEAARALSPIASLETAHVF